MQPLSRQRLTANAYRVLGLRADASQEAIDAAARRLRIWADPAMVPATPGDLPWLGPLSRAKNDVEQAVTRLSDPVSRLQERLLWYVDPETINWHVGLETTGGIISHKIDQFARHANEEADDRPGLLHDAALAQLHAACLSGSDDTNGGRWQRALAAL